LKTVIQLQFFCLYFWSNKCSLNCHIQYRWTQAQTGWITNNLQETGKTKPTRGQNVDRTRRE